MANDTGVGALTNIDDFLRYGSKIGSLKQAVSNNLYGLNYSGVTGAIPYNEENVGLIMLTRPQLNLSTANIRNNRKLYGLLTGNPLSVQSFVRTTLDPRLALGLNEEPSLEGETVDSGAGGSSDTVTCPLVDPEMAFIPILSNTCTAASGWPDIVAPTFTSDQGLRREQYSQVDGIVDIFESYDVDLTFRNQVSDPIVYLFYVWLVYQSGVFEGTLVPYLDFLKENEIDYNTRVYRLVLDKNRRYVSKLFATGVSFPLTVPTSQFFDFSSNAEYYSAVKEFTIRFRCLGANFNDDILIKEFNETVGIFNGGMRTLNRKIDDFMVEKAKANEKFKQEDIPEVISGTGLEKVPYPLRDAANFRMYPRIDPITYELEWYAKSNFVQMLKRMFKYTDDQG